MPALQALELRLDRHGYQGTQAPVFIPSFETQNLRKLHRMTPVPLVQGLISTGLLRDFTANPSLMIPLMNG